MFILEYVPMTVEIPKRVFLGLAFCFGVTCCLLPALPDTALGQEKAAGDELEVMELGGNDLVTRDFVSLAAKFYPGAADKDTVTVILLHAFKGSRKDFSVLAPYLAEQGYAVMVPDLRGHGDSTNKLEVRGGRQQVVKLDAAKMRANNFAQIANNDMGALRRFLVVKNNEGKLNLNKLVIVGMELGAAVAVDWAVYDWSIPDYPGVKQSKDVKALVLISPKRTYSGLRTSQALNHGVIQSVLPIMIVVGNDDRRAASDATYIHSKIQSIRREEFLDLTPAEAFEKRTLWFFPVPTTLQSAKLLNAKPLKMPSMIHKFIDLRVAKNTSGATAWVEHATPR
jgi:pimeloyl-ACP methyl ester carboxylesterase